MKPAEEINELHPQAIKEKETWLAARKQWKEFIATPIGAAFDKFERAHADAWRKDASLEYTDRGEKSAKIAWEKSDAARKEFLSKLCELASIHDVFGGI